MVITEEPESKGSPPQKAQSERKPKKNHFKEPIGNGMLNYGSHSFEGGHKNEDVVNIIHPYYNDSHCGFFGIYDGHHGLNCSTFIAEKIPHVLEGNLDIDLDITTALTNTYLEVDKMFLMHAHSLNPVLTDGSTAISLLILNGLIYVANTGDCRAIMSQGEEIIVMTNDHKANDPKEEERIKARGGTVLGGRVQGRIMVSRSFGDMEFKDNDTFEGKYLVCDPDIFCYEITSKSNFIIIASDGLWDVLSNEDAINFVKNDLKENLDPNVVAENLVKEAYENRSEDNISAIIIIFDKKIKKSLMKESKKKQKQINKMQNLKVNKKDKKKDRDEGRRRTMSGLDHDKQDSTIKMTQSALVKKDKRKKLDV